MRFKGIILRLKWYKIENEIDDKKISNDEESLYNKCWCHRRKCNLYCKTRFLDWMIPVGRLKI